MGPRCSSAETQVVTGATLQLGYTYNYDVDLTFIPTQISNSEHGLYIHKYLIRYTHIELSDYTYTHLSGSWAICAQRHV